jgi:hypothetical protein
MLLKVRVPHFSTRSTNVLLPKIRSGLKATNSTAKRCARQRDCAAKLRDEPFAYPPEAAMPTAYRGLDCMGTGQNRKLQIPRHRSKRL